MQDDRTRKPRSSQAPDREAQEKQARETAHTARPAERESKKPTPIERAEWRGAGVCGDSHTD